MVVYGLTKGYYHDTYQRKRREKAPKEIIVVQEKVGLNKGTQEAYRLGSHDEGKIRPVCIRFSVQPGRK